MKAWLAIAVALCLATPARAQGVTTIFPLSGPLPKSLKGASGELTRVLAKSLGAEVANVPIEDAAELMECDLGQKSCLTNIAKSVGASTIVFGRIERRGDGIAIALTTFDGASEHKSRYAIEGDSADSLATALQKELDHDTTKDEPEPKPKAKGETKAKPKTEPEAEKQPGQITNGTWGLMIGGGVTFAIGSVTLLTAQSLKKQVNTAPTDTRAQIDHLRALERAGKARVQIGGALMAVGGIAAGIGIVRAYMQHSSAPEKPLIDVVPESGGASVWFTKEWR